MKPRWSIAADKDLPAFQSGTSPRRVQQAVLIRAGESEHRWLSDSPVDQRLGPVPWVALESTSEARRPAERTRRWSVATTPGAPPLARQACGGRNECLPARSLACREAGTCGPLCVPSVRSVPCRTGSSSTADGPGDLISSADQTLRPGGLQGVEGPAGESLGSTRRHIPPAGMRPPAAQPSVPTAPVFRIPRCRGGGGTVSHQCRNDRIRLARGRVDALAGAGPGRSRTTAARSWTGAPALRRTHPAGPRHCLFGRLALGHPRRMPKSGPWPVRPTPQTSGPAPPQSPRVSRASSSV